MFLRSGALAAFLSLLSASAFSAVLTIDFTAHITSLNGNGMGYKVGDSISGNYVIDVSKAEGYNILGSTDITYYGSDTSGLASSNFSRSPSGYFDLVSVGLNNHYVEDTLMIDKLIDFQNGVLDVVGSYISFLGVNWLHNFNLDNINFFTDDATLLAPSYGMFMRWDVNSFLQLERAEFTYDSVKMVSSSVPEPSMGALLVLGLLSLGARRRLLAAKC